MIDFEFFKPAEIKCFPEISRELYLLHMDKINTTKTGAVEIPWSEENYLELYHEVNELMKPRRVIKCRFFITAPHSKLGMHVDVDLNKNAYALNIPIFVDTKDHFMNWYEYDGDIKHAQTATYNKSVSPAEPEKAVLKKSLTMVEPTFVQVGIFHGVLNKSSLPRVILSIRFSDSFIN
jgi:hypothetical protein